MNPWPARHKGIADARLAVALALAFFALGLAGWAVALRWGESWIRAGASKNRAAIAAELAWREALAGNAPLEDAARALEEAIQARPDRASLKARLADVAERQGRRAEAIRMRAEALADSAAGLEREERQAIGRACQAAAQRAREAGAAGEALERLEFRAALMAEDAAAAALAFERLAPLLQSEAERLFLESQLAAAQGVHVLKVYNLRQCLAIDPGHREAAIALAHSYYPEPGFLEIVVEALRGALERHPADAQLWHLLGQFLYRDRDFAGAAEALERACALAPANALPLFDLAEALERLGAERQARAARARAKALDPGASPPPLAGRLESQ